MIAAIAAVFTLVFLALKVPGRIDWSWWVVFSPMLVLGVLTLFAGVQMWAHQRAHLKQSRALMESIMQEAGGSPIDRLTAMLSSLGKPPDPPVA